MSFPSPLAMDNFISHRPLTNGELWRVPVASLTDGRTPEQRAQDSVTVSPRPAGTVETFEGITTDPFRIETAGGRLRSGAPACRDHAALTTDITQPPWIVAKVFVFGQQ